MAMTDTEFKAWAAGFFDGEGCVMIARLKFNGQPHHHQVRVSVGQKVKAPLIRLQDRWGGVVRAYRESRTNRHADMYDWRLNGAAAIAFLADVEPYLVVKHEQAAIAREFGVTLLTWGGNRSRPQLTDDVKGLREGLCVRIHEANRRGRAA